MATTLGGKDARKVMTKSPKTLIPEGKILNHDEVAAWRKSSGVSAMRDADDNFASTAGSQMFSES